MSKIPFDSDRLFYDLKFFGQDEELIRLATACLDVQQRRHSEILNSAFRPNPDAAEAVSEAVLAEILRAGKSIHGITEDREISNVIAFNLSEIKGSVESREIAEARQKLDKAVFNRIEQLFHPKREIVIINSGHFWYPPGGYMGWHTNRKLPGWRLYITHAQESGKSFFRYRDPDTSEIVTAWDREWNFRLFKIDPKRPFWHAVYSETDRHSFGYNAILAPKPALPERIVRKAKQLLAR